MDVKNYFYDVMLNNNLYSGNLTEGQAKNRFVYVKQNVHSIPQKVLVNPHFGKKVFVNPNFTSGNKVPQSSSIYVNPRMSSQSSIHINPLVKSIQLPSQTVHINPNFKQQKNNTDNKPVDTLNTTVLLTSTKLIRTTAVNKVKKRRHSVKSKYKIVKSNPKKVSARSRNCFKVDNRKKLDTVRTSLSQRKCSIVAKYKIVRRLSHINNRKTQAKENLRSRYKLIKRKLSERSFNIKKFKLSRKHVSKKLATKTKVMKKCNIPCPFYKKYGICKGKESGKCFRKHDPQQVALCTKFLQGACINEKCLLSHNVSAEKMPTCKYYLEGSCSRESCPYLHVKISPKADVCRDFLEGFCVKAIECPKRHQYLCPDYEKHGKCPKVRCAYPHGKLVRSYTVNTQKFTKNCSELCKNTKCEQELKSRYYVDEISKSEDVNSVNAANLMSRPQLGQLPSFIPFSES